MKKFEYLIAEPPAGSSPTTGEDPRRLIQWLNVHGEQGWEVIAGCEDEFLFKREKRDD